MLEVTSTTVTPRWLTDHEQSAWLELIRIMLTLPAALDSQLRRRASLNHYEYRVLGVLGEQPSHAMNLKSLAAVTNASLSRLSHVLKRLEATGLIRRRSSTVDNRSSEAVLTEAGLATLTAAAPEHVETVRALVFDGLDQDDVVQLADLLSRIAPDPSHPVARYHKQMTAT